MSFLSQVKEYSGSSFFDDWTYYGNYDNLTNVRFSPRTLIEIFTAHSSCSRPS